MSENVNSSRQQVNIFSEKNVGLTEVLYGGIFLYFDCQQTQSRPGWTVATAAVLL